MNGKLKMTNEKPDTLEILKVFADFDDCDAVWWRTDNDYAPVTFLVNCNDTFFWGASDCEAIESNQDIADLRQAYQDCENHNDYNGTLLWICRKRKMRPQNAMYSYIDGKAWHLFNECGEKREVDIGNPFKMGEYKNEARG